MLDDINNFIKSNKKGGYTCTQMTNNPYVCSYAPVSQIVIPQGEIIMPSTIIQSPEIQTIPQSSPTLQNVNYNQITPYINSNSPVFQPKITTKSGEIITIAPPEISKPVTQESAKVVYQGPVNEINPQVTPVEKFDNEVAKAMHRYYNDKAKYNEELRSAIKNSIRKKKKSSVLGVLKIFGISLLAVLAYKYRANIPVIKKFIK